jgi:hypothetical protein
MEIQNFENRHYPDWELTPIRGEFLLEFLLKDQSPHPDAPPYDDQDISIPGPSGLPMTLYIGSL